MRAIAFLAVLGLCGVASAQVVEGPAIDPNAPPRFLRVTYKGQTIDLPMVDNLLVTPPWWDSNRQAYTPPRSGLIIYYSTPLVVPVRWRIDVKRKALLNGNAEDWMSFGVYDGNWQHWSEWRFKSISADNGAFAIQPVP